jgi:ubiquinone/menaquinone biosynthesis C-methylase UbiE
MWPFQNQAQGKPSYERRTMHDPNGTGIFYMDREIAQVMGHEGADWLERPEREVEEAPDVLVRALKLKPGMIVADIGAGSGYFSFRMAPRVGTKGKILAVDIQPEMLAIINERSRIKRVKNVETVLGKTDDTCLKPETVDLILLVDVYHEFDKPYEMTNSMVKSLKKGGRLVLVEYRKEDRRVPIKEVHKMSQAQLRKEMGLFPVKWVETNPALPWQHIVIFEKL